jgi:hypothetical protein
MRLDCLVAHAHLIPCAFSHAFASTSVWAYCKRYRTELCSACGSSSNQASHA